MGRDNDFEGKVIALTGGASGIGLGTAQIIHARGATVSIADVDQNALDKAAKLFKDRASFTKVDVTDRKAVDEWITKTVEKFGHLDGAANCAGVIGKHHGTRNAEDVEDDQWHLILNVNLTGMMYALRAQLKAIQGPGSIVCVSSIQGTMGFAKHAAYSVSRMTPNNMSTSDSVLGIETWHLGPCTERSKRGWSAEPKGERCDTVESSISIRILDLANVIDQWTNPNALDGQTKRPGRCDTRQLRANTDQSTRHG